MNVYVAYMPSGDKFWDPWQFQRYGKVWFLMLSKTEHRKVHEENRKWSWESHLNVDQLVVMREATIDCFNIAAEHHPDWYWIHDLNLKLEFDIFYLTNHGRTM